MSFVDVMNYASYIKISTLIHFLPQGRGFRATLNCKLKALLCFTKILTGQVE